MKEHIVELVALVVAVVGAGGVISLFGDVAQMILARPRAFAFTAILCGVIGFAIAYLLGIRDYRMKKLEYRQEDIEAEKKQREDAERRIRSNIKMFKEEPCAIKKAMAAEIYKQHGHKTSVDIIGKTELERMESNYGAVNAWHQYFIFDARGENYWYVELIGWVIELFDANPDLVHEFPAETKGQCREILEMCIPE